MPMHHHTPLPALAALLIALLLGGCASPVPLPIRQGPLDSPSPAVVREHVGDYAGRAVRWGGVLIATENRADITRLTVLARPLSSDGEPGTGDSNLGRFIAIVPGFLDPQDYAADRRVTVTGTLAGSELGRVGNHPYAYPVVEAQAWYLWPEPEPPYGYPYPWWYDPWYGPWWYGSWYDPWYYPGYYPRWYPHHYPHRPRPDRPGVAPDARPIMPHPGHPHPVAPAPRRRPEAGTPPPPVHHAEPRREAPPAERQRPDQREPRERPPAGTTPPPAHHVEPPRARNVERQRERMERDVERPQPEPAQLDRPDAERGLRGVFRRWRGD